MMNDPFDLLQRYPESFKYCEEDEEPNFCEPGYAYRYTMDDGEVVLVTRVKSHKGT
jgi:hypothetical protein